MSTTPFDGRVQVEPVFGDGRPAVWRWGRPQIDERPDDLVCRVVKGKNGDRVDVYQRDWLHRDVGGGRRKKLRTIWLAEEIGSTDTAVAELKELVGHVFESPKPTGLVRRILGTMPDDGRCSTSSPAAGRRATRSRSRTPRTAAPAAASASTPPNPPARAPTPINAGLTTVADITRARLAAVARERHGRDLDPRRLLQRLELAPRVAAAAAGAGPSGGSR